MFMYIGVTMLILHIYATTVITHRGVAGVIGKAHAINCKLSTALIEYLTVLIEYIDLFQFSLLGHSCVGLGPTRPTLGYAPDYISSNS